MSAEDEPLSSARRQSAWQEACETLAEAEVRAQRANKALEAAQENEARTRNELIAPSDVPPES